MLVRHHRLGLRVVGVGLVVGSLVVLSGLALAGPKKVVSSKPADSSPTKVPRNAVFPAPKTSTPKIAKSMPSPSAAPEPVTVLCRGGMLVWVVAPEGMRLVGKARRGAVGRWGKALRAGECGSPGAGWSASMRAEIRMVRNDNSHDEDRKLAATTCARDPDCVFAIEATWSAADGAWLSKIGGLSATKHHPGVVSWPHGTTWPDAGQWW